MTDKKQAEMDPNDIIAWGIAHLPDLINLKKLMDAQDNIANLIAEGQQLLRVGKS